MKRLMVRRRVSAVSNHEAVIIEASSLEMQAAPAPQDEESGAFFSSSTRGKGKNNKRPPRLGGLSV
jgi:hypothetical protein